MTDILIVVAMAACTAAYAALAAAIPVLNIGDPLGPRAFPTLIAVGMGLSALLLLGEIWRARRRAAPSAPAQSQPPLGGRGILTLGAVVALFALYILVVEPLGFVLASAAFLMVCCTLLNRRAWRVHALVAVGLPLALYGLLAKLLMVPLPAGLLPF